MKRKSKKPEIIFFENGFKSFIKVLDLQKEEINKGYRREYNLNQAIGIGLLIGLVSLIFN